MINEKEDLINNISNELLNMLNVQQVNQIKEVLIIKMKDVEVKYKEKALAVAGDETSQVVKKFIACKKLAGLTDRSLKAYLSELAMFFKNTNKSYTAISTDDIRVYLAMSRKNNNEISIDNKRRYLNSFFDWCFNEELIERNPVKKINKIKSKKQVREAFSDIEIEKMRSVLVYEKVYAQKKYQKETRLRNIAIFETLLSTGTRVTELISIKREQVDKGQDSLVILGKGKKERPVYLNARAIIAIKNYLKERKDSNEYLFVSHPITHLSNQKDEISSCTQSCIECMVRKLGKRVNVEAYPHKFRRTAATNAVRKGMPIEQVQKMLGHATLNTTQIYVNVSDMDVKISHDKYLS